MIAFARIDGRTTVHLRGPETRARTMSCARDSEFFGAEFRLGSYVRGYPPGGLANLQDAPLPTLPDGRVLLDNRAWEMPTPQNIDVFVDRLRRARLLAFDPLVEALQHGDGPGRVPERTAQSRFARAVGMSHRTVVAIDRAHHAARLLPAGSSIPDVVPPGRLPRPAAPDPGAASADRSDPGRPGERRAVPLPVTAVRYKTAPLRTA